MTDLNLGKIHVSRRSVAVGAAWTIPSVMAAGTAPAFAASPACATGATTADVAFSVATTGMQPVSGTSGANGVRQAVGDNWVWRGTSYTGYRQPLAYTATSTTSNVWDWGLALYNADSTPTAATPGANTAYNTASARPSSCTVPGVNPPLSMPYVVFKGDPLYSEPTTPTSATFMAIATKSLNLCPGCDYIFSIDVWSDFQYARDLKVQMGWVAAAGVPTSTTATSPSSWLSAGGTPTVFRGSNGANTAVTTISTTITRNTATSALVLLKVTADTAADVAAYTGTTTRTGVQTCDGGVNDLVFANPSLTAVCA